MIQGRPGFFSLEGVDGSGKTTQLALLADRLRTMGREVVTVREPGGTPVSDKIRQLILSPENPIVPSAELLLFSAARAQLVAQVIQPALEAGKVVLADRFGWSTLAYQGYGRGMDFGPIRELFRIACGDVWPLHSFLLDLPIHSMRDRLAAGGRPADRMESESAPFFERVRLGYLSIAAENPDRFTVIDGGQAAETVQQAILSKLLPLL
ncbi:MAG: thymidylate kinase [Fibrobacteres bacterium]|nr:thymidylate kinase [Fibrobacterota bacterium]